VADAMIEAQKRNQCALIGALLRRSVTFIQRFGSAINVMMSS